MRRPTREEAAAYYFTYIDQVRGDDLLAELESQEAEVARLLGGISEERSLHRYQADKWSIRELLGHVNDCERLFAFRALWFARGFDTPLPSFDQAVATAHAGSDGRSWEGHVGEFRALRAATLALLRGLPEEAWERTGVASGYPFTVRALAFVIAGHAAHHVRVLNERYLAG